MQLIAYIPILNFFQACFSHYSLLVASLFPSGVKSKSIKFHEFGAGFSIHYQGKAGNTVSTEPTAVMGVFQQMFDASWGIYFAVSYLQQLGILSHLGKPCLVTKIKISMKNNMHVKY